MWYLLAYCTYCVFTIYIFVIAVGPDDHDVTWTVPVQRRGNEACLVALWHPHENCLQHILATKH